MPARTTVTRRVRTRIVIPVLEGNICPGSMLNFLMITSRAAVISMYQYIVKMRAVAKERIEQAKIRTGWRYHLDELCIVSIVKYNKPFCYFVREPSGTTFGTTIINSVSIPGMLVQSIVPPRVCVTILKTIDIPRPVPP